MLMRDYAATGSFGRIDLDSHFMDDAHPSNSGVPRASGISQPGSKPGKVPTEFGPCRILIVDDIHLIALSIQATVNSLGHKAVAIARDAEDAIALARSHLPDIILMDITMPGEKDGIDAASDIFKELAIPSVIVSAYSDEEKVAGIQRNGEDSGVFGFILKPVNVNELRVTLGLARQRAAVDAVKGARVEQLQRNLTNRRIVEQAKWILVEKHKMNEATAHDRLQKLARDRRKQLVDIAQMVIDMGDLPK